MFHQESLDRVGADNAIDFVLETFQIFSASKLPQTAAGPSPGTLT